MLDVAGLLVVLIFSPSGEFVTTLTAPVEYNDCVKNAHQGVPETQSDPKIENGAKFVTISACVKLDDKV